MDHNKIYIPCIGFDFKKHVCEPHLNTALCGMKVRRKEVYWSDLLLSCPECTFKYLHTIDVPSSID